MRRLWLGLPLIVILVWVLRPAAGIVPEDSPSYRMRTDMFASFPVRADVVMLGDSLTEVADWRAMLPGIDVENQGISGDTTVGVLRRIDLVNKTGARVVALMIGVNDLQKGQSVDSAAGRYRKIIESLSAKCIIVESTLFTDRGAELNGKIASLNNEVKKYCHGKCRYLDLNDAIAPDGVLPKSRSVDGLHLNGAGYAPWRDRIRPAIESCN